ncbi:Metacaspase [Steccherinum ochraceum]|uniref:Metacaspase n=1 Tax=Steccherinum ochraceum TaxID=92696 RepID=A0A4R0R906_9APHY|nr:Metacaspase [Steccherinum ochraceum]
MSYHDPGVPPHLTGWIPFTPPYSPAQIPSEARDPWRKALLVGITYAHRKVPKIKPLTNPVRDVHLFKDLLEDSYGFKEEDIVVMTDAEETEARYKPSKANMLREIGRLVAKAQAGDSFVFLFAGHSEQQDTRSGTELDEKDEVIVAMDGGKIDKNGNRLGGIITDNDLKKRLVKPLPDGAHLTVSSFYIYNALIFNSVTNFRHCLTLVPPELFSVPAPSIFTRPPAAQQSWNSLPRTPRDDVEDWMRRTREQLTFSFAYAGSLVGLPVYSSGSFDFERLPHLEIPGRPTQILDEPMVTSPDVMTEDLPWHCNGYCPISEEEGPSVLSFSACQDGETSYEDDVNPGLVEIMIKILERDHHPTLEALIKALRMDMRNASNQRVNTFRRNVEAFSSETGVLIDPHFMEATELRMVKQHPQVGSLKPINRHAPFALAPNRSLS